MEYKILTGSASDVQMKLNQWKHQFDIDILGISATDNLTTILLIRHPKSIRVRLAEYAHNAWAGWMKYLFSKSKRNNDGTVTIPKWAVDRWTRQMNTTYNQLPNEEKESDLNEADKIIDVFKSV